MIGGILTVTGLFERRTTVWMDGLYQYDAKIDYEPVVLKNVTLSVV